MDHSSTSRSSLYSSPPPTLCVLFSGALHMGWRENRGGFVCTTLVSTELSRGRGRAEEGYLTNLFPDNRHFDIRFFFFYGVFYSILPISLYSSTCRASRYAVCIAILLRSPSPLFSLVPIFNSSCCSCPPSFSDSRFTVANFLRSFLFHEQGTNFFVRSKCGIER